MNFDHYPITLIHKVFSNHSGRPLSADELRILNIVLVEYLHELKDVGLSFETDIAATDQPGVDKSSTDQSVITKKRVVECLQLIGQQELAGILSKRHGKMSNEFKCLI